MTLAFNAEKYHTDSKKSKTKKYLDITEEIKSNLVEKAIEKNLKVEQILNLKIEFDEECEFNEEALTELKTNIHLIKQPKDGKCIFIEDNVAWVGQDEKNEIVRYFSKNRKTGEYFYLDIIDIYSIVARKEYNEAVTDLLSSYKFKTKEEERKKKQRGKYRNNVSFLENIFEWREKYPYTAKMLGNCLDVLIMLNKEGLKKVLGDVCMLDGESVFYASLRHISRQIELDNNDGKKVNNRKISGKVNFLCLLGFIEKLDIERVPAKVRERGEKERKDKKLRMINYYIAKRITPELLEEIERMAAKLWSKRINKGNISYEKINKILGEEVANRVYPNMQGNKNEKKRNGENNIEDTKDIEDIIEPEDFERSPLF